MPDDVVIRIKKQTRERLVELGKKTDTYDSIINTLIDCFLERIEKH